MERVALQFQTPEHLADFCKYAGDRVFKTDITNLIVYCNITSDLINIALNQYEAIVIDLPNG